MRTSADTGSAGNSSAPALRWTHPEARASPGPTSCSSPIPIAKGGSKLTFDCNRRPFKLARKRQYCPSHILLLKEVEHAFHHLRPIRCRCDCFEWERQHDNI